MKFKTVLMLLLLSFSLWSCTGKPKSLQDLPVLPDGQHLDECDKIKHDKAQVRSNLQQSRMSFPSPIQILILENDARKEYETLKARSSAAGCSTAPSHHNE
jgi:hypothetical protein